MHKLQIETSMKRVSCCFERAFALLVMMGCASLAGKGYMKSGR